jgi:EAL domain-containing protein (putative c-di-GMP-specific phosphodiesterase class I)
VTTDTSDAQIAASVIALAHSMNLRVVAEGIETEDQLAFLKSHGCDQGQGYLFSRPCPPTDLASRFLKNQKKPLIIN